MAKSKQKKQTRKPITFDEFKAWLSGVEDLQAADWFPTKEQWDIIREKIESIKITTPVVEAPYQPTAFQQPIVPQRPVFAPQMPLQSSIGQEVIEQAPSQQPPRSRHVSKLPSTFDGKTPSIGTSSGNFGSSFE